MKKFEQLENTRLTESDRRALYELKSLSSSKRAFKGLQLLIDLYESLFSVKLENEIASYIENEVDDDKRANLLIKVNSINENSIKKYEDKVTHTFVTEYRYPKNSIKLYVNTSPTSTKENLMERISEVELILTSASFNHFAIIEKKLNATRSIKVMDSQSYDPMLLTTLLFSHPNYYLEAKIK